MIDFTAERKLWKGKHLTTVLEELFAKRQITITFAEKEPDQNIWYIYYNNPVCTPQNRLVCSSKNQKLWAIDMIIDTERM